MNINEDSVLELLNKLIIIDRLNKSQILHMVNLVSLSKDICDLKENLQWENIYIKNKNNLKNPAISFKE